MQTRTQTAAIFHIERVRSLRKVYRALCDARMMSHFQTESEYQFAKDNLLILLLSSLFSVFDNSGVNLLQVQWPGQLAVHRREIEGQWAQVSKQIELIRHNLGFHGAKNEKTAEHGTKQFAELGEDNLVACFDLFEKLFAFADSYHQLSSAEP